MDRIDADFRCQRDNILDVQVRSNRFAGVADQVRFVRFEAVQGVAIFVRVDRDGADIQFVGTAKNANGDFATIGDESFGDFLHLEKGNNNGVESEGATASSFDCESGELLQPDIIRICGQGTGTSSRHTPCDRAA